MDYENPKAFTKPEQVTLRNGDATPRLWPHTSKCSSAIRPPTSFGRKARIIKAVTETTLSADRATLGPI